MAKAIQTVSMIPISSVFVPDVPNRVPGWEKALADLTESIKANGQVQPIVVAPMASPGPDGEEFELVAGERRLEALKKLKHTTVKAVAVPAKATKKDKFATRISENFGRCDYSPIEEALLVQYAIDAFDMTQQQVAALVGKTSGWVSQRVTALKQPEDIQQALEEGDITFTHMREFGRVKDEKEKKKLLKKAKSLDGSEFKEYVDDLVSGDEVAARSQKAKRPTDEEILRPRREALSVLKKLDKSMAEAKSAGEKGKAAHLGGIIKGVSWSYKLQGAKIDM